LGFIGEEYKIQRKVLLEQLPGNAAFKGGSREPAQETESGDVE